MLITEIDKHIADAMKERITLKEEGKDLTQNATMLEALKSIKAELVKEHHNNPGMTEVDEAKLILKMADQRRESMNIYMNNGRGDLAEKEHMELTTIIKFAPTIPSEDEVREFTEASVSAYIVTKEQGYKLSMRDMKPIMDIVKGKYPMADGKVISSEVKKIIGG